MAANPDSSASKAFVIRVAERAPGHKLIGYAFVQQTAFFAAHDDGTLPEIRIVQQGLEQLFDRGGEYAFAAVPFDTDDHAGVQDDDRREQARKRPLERLTLP